MTETANVAPLRPTLTLSIVSDTICPWCFIGKRRLETALPLLGEQGYRFDVEWRPYQLNPDMPDVGVNRRDYRSAKFGWERSQELDAMVVEAGREVGIDFRYDLIDRTPNTLASHVMLADALCAGGEAMQGKAVEALFTAYFVEGRDVGKQDVLRDIAASVGFEHGRSVNARLWEVVQAEDLQAREAGLNGVPSFLLEGHFMFSGAQPTDVLVKTLRHAVDMLSSTQLDLPT